MRVIELWRHPVKSLQGEQCPRAELESNGMVGDRGWGILDSTTGKILTARRAPALLLATGHLDGDGVPVIDLPDGTRVEGAGDAADERLSTWLGRSVRLVPARAIDTAVAEFFEDATDDSSRAIEWTMPEGRFVDAEPLLVLTTASLRHAAGLYPEGTWTTRRFRPNIVIDVEGDDWIEDAWLGHEVRVGTATIVPVAQCVRCTMVTRPQPGLEHDVDIFRTLARNHRGTFGVWATVSLPGAVRVDDTVTID
jgi:uncharacterized protein